MRHSLSHGPRTMPLVRPDSGTHHCRCLHMTFDCLPTLPARLAAPPLNEDAALHRLWLLRLLVNAGLLAEMLSFRSHELLRLWQELGLQGLERQPGKDDYGALHCKLETALAEAEVALAGYIPGSVVARNVKSLAEALCLGDGEADILLFVLVKQDDRWLNSVLRDRELRSQDVEMLLATVLDREPHEIRSALRPTSALRESGLFSVESLAGGCFHDCVGVIRNLTEQISREHAHPLDMFRNRIARLDRGDRVLADYPHLSGPVSVIRALVGRAIDEHTSGVNVLLYGPPGTGKSELVRALAADLEACLYEVASQPEDGEPLNAEDRLRAWRLSRPLLARVPRALLLFDEVEDVFAPHVDATGYAGQIKAYMNRALETNTVPTVWVTNQVHCLDPAFVRRFDYTLCVDVPPRSVRRQIVDGYFRDLPVSETFCAGLSGFEELPPGVVARAARLGRLVGDQLPAENLEPAVMRSVQETLGAMRLEATWPADVSSSLPWRPEVLHVDCDLAALQDAIRARPQGRLCFHGVSGAGKTALAHRLAEISDRPLYARRVSDLVGSYVGQTERNIAHAFREATRANAVLLIDEADSLLRDRRGAQRGYEVSQVNELLTQMEAFDGLFIASTNLMETLDAASLRRFDLKVRFKYLRAEQAWILFEEACRLLGLVGDELVRPALAHLTVLAPGDFATVLRRARLQPVADARALVRLLEAECELKPDRPRRAIGFAS